MGDSSLPRSASLRKLLDFFQNDIGINHFSAFRLGSPALKFGFEFRKRRLAIPLLLFKQPQSFANDFAGGLVSAAGDALLDELFEFGRKRDIQAGSYWHNRIIGSKKACVKLCYRVKSHSGTLNRSQNARETSAKSGLR